MTTEKELLFDVEQIKREAKQDLNKGALTTDYTLDVKQVCEHLNNALATEILCVLRYRHHQVIAKGIDQPQVAAEFAEHALEEEKHMMMIAERINQLGGDPDFNPSNIHKKSMTEFGSGTDLLAMIKEDLIAERTVIMIYRKLIEWFGVKDPTTRRMLESILKDEENHADDLSNLIAQKEGV